MDGVSANFGVTGYAVLVQSAGGALPALSVSGGTNSLVSVDATQEFRIQTSSFAPEFGRTPGGQISIVTRSGTNDFHGTLFEYFRNNALDARDWFVNFNGLAKPEERQNDFGGVLGGPITQRQNVLLFLLRRPAATPAIHAGNRRSGRGIAAASPSRRASIPERVSRRQRPGTWERIGAIQRRLLESFLARRNQPSRGSCH